MEIRKEIKELLTEGKLLEASIKIISTMNTEWDDIVSPTCEDPSLNYTPSEYQDLLRVLSTMASRATMASEYIGYRGAFGLGDSGHDDSLNKAKAKVKKVRKAMGYSNP